jgi:hypothetical protein
MKVKATFTNWAIVDGWEAFNFSTPVKYWGICEGSDYPFLLSQFSSYSCPVAESGSNDSSALSAGVPGIFLYVAGSAGRLVEGTPVYHGAAGIAPNTSYTLSVQRIGARALTRTVLAGGETNGRGHVEGRIGLGSLAPGSYKIVMTGYHALGYPLVLTNHLTVGTNGAIVSVSAESQQPFLK